MGLWLYLIDAKWAVLGGALIPMCVQSGNLAVRVAHRKVSTLNAHWYECLKSPVKPDAEKHAVYRKGAERQQKLYQALLIIIEDVRK